MMKGFYWAGVGNKVDKITLQHILGLTLRDTASRLPKLISMS